MDQHERRATADLVHGDARLAELGRLDLEVRTLRLGPAMRQRRQLGNRLERQLAKRRGGHVWSYHGRAMKKFPDFVPPTKVTYLDRGPTLHLRRCTLEAVDDPNQAWVFDKEEVRIGSMDDNDVVLGDDTVSRYHCKITQEDNGYVLVD